MQRKMPDWKLHGKFEFNQEQLAKLERKGGKKSVVDILSRGNLWINQKV
jgi:hypothetical protein